MYSKINDEKLTDYLLITEVHKKMSKLVNNDRVIDSLTN